MATLAVVSDPHTNSKVGLFPKYWKDSDGMGHSPNKIQIWLWDCWVDFWQEVQEIRGKDELYVVFNGDVVDGDHHGTTQIVTRNISEQADIAFECLAPVLDLKPDYSYFTVGTEVHVGKGGQDEESIARFLAEKMRVEKDPETDSFVWWWLPLKIEGVNFDIAHHGRGGYRPWTAHNAANILAAELTFDYFGEIDPPDIAIRSHVHYASDTGDNYPIRVMYTNPWQQSTAYGYRIKPGQRKLKAGGLIFKIENGEYEVTKKEYRPPKQRYWSKPDGPDHRKSTLAGVGKIISRIGRNSG